MRTRRTSADAEETPLPPHGAAPPPTNTVPRMPCPGCSTPVEGPELAKYGNRCASCYEAFCRAAQRSGAHLPDKRTGGPLAWAFAIVERHRQGQHVPPAQLQMAKDAIAGRHGLPLLGDDA